MNKQNRSIANVRTRLIEKLGASCRRCGFADVRALQIDLVRGDNAVERGLSKPNRSTYYKKVLEDVTGKYQLLCANCAWIKRHETVELAAEPVAKAKPKVKVSSRRRLPYLRSSEELGAPLVARRKHGPTT